METKQCFTCKELIPASLDNIIKLHEKSLSLLQCIKDMQCRIEVTANIINGDHMFKHPKDQDNLELRLRAKQRLLNSYRKLIVEINNQTGII